MIFIPLCTVEDVFINFLFFFPKVGDDIFHDGFINFLQVATEGSAVINIFNSTTRLDMHDRSFEMLPRHIKYIYIDIVLLFYNDILI